MAGYGNTSGPMSGAEKFRQHKERQRKIERRQCENPARRSRLEKNTPNWLMHYMGNAFPMKWSDSHIKIIEYAEQAALSGTGTTVAAPRGEGKTTVLRGVAINLLARGVVRFPVLTGWKHRDAKTAFAAWLRMLAESPEFRADYPEITQPFEISSHATALKSLVWEDTGQRIGAMVSSIDLLITLPDSMGAIAARSAQGDAKGLNATLLDGTVLRPDLLLLDDAQDPKRADNPTAVADTVDTIENVFMGMAGPQNRLTTFCACTVEAENDVSEHFLARPGWNTIRVSRIEEWPTDFDNEDSPARRGWEEWNRQRLDKGEKAARKYYREHKATLTDGMRVSWNHRYTKGKDVDALYSAMWEYYDKGPDVFARAQQNRPLKHEANVYELTPAIITSRTTDRERGKPVDGAMVTVASTDLNPSYAFTSGIVAFGEMQRAWVLTYGLYRGATGNGIAKGDDPAHVRASKVYEALTVVGNQFASLECKPDTWFIDAGGTDFDAVVRFCQESAKLCGIQAIAATGRSHDKYRPYARSAVRRGEQCHSAFDKQTGRRWFVWDSHYWHEIAQRAWLGAAGAPGTIDLPKGSNREFAEQICRERLVAKGEVGGEMVWKYATQPGPHDYGDVMAQAYAGAAWHGIGTGGVQLQQKPANRRRIRHVKW